MSRWLCLLGAFLCLSPLVTVQAAAQGTGDHDDAPPIESGYVVVTPVSPVTGLTITETFGLKVGAETLQTSFPEPDVLTTANMFVDVNESLGRNLGVALVNPNNSFASVTFTVRGNTGTILGSRTISVEPRRQTAQFITSLVPITSSPGGFGGAPPPLTEYTGTLAIVSNIPISVLGVRFRGTTFSSGTTTNRGSALSLPLIAQGVGGASAFLLPHFVTGGGWETQIVVSNTNSASVTIRVDLFKQDGSPLTAALNGTRASTFTNLVVPPNGVLVLSPRDADGDDRF